MSLVGVFFYESSSIRGRHIARSYFSLECLFCSPISTFIAWDSDMARHPAEMNCKATLFEEVEFAKDVLDHGGLALEMVQCIQT